MDENEKLKLEIKLKELESKIESSKNKFHNSKISLLGWIVLITIIVAIWFNIKPILAKLDFLLDTGNSTLNKINAGANTGNEILNKVNHPIDSAAKGLGF